MKDNFTEQFKVRGGEERVNKGPWRPAGALAAAVLAFPYETPRAKFRPGKYRRLMKALTSPDLDVERMLADVKPPLEVVKRHGIDQLWLYVEKHDIESHPVLSLASRQLSRVRKVVERVVQSSLDTGATGPAPESFRITEQLVRWIGCTNTEDHFRATPAGAVLLSALHGRHRGRLQVCAACGKFISVSRRGFRRRYCENCKKLSQGQVDLATGLLLDKAIRWQKVLSRMRRRGFKRLGLDNEEKYEWKVAALQALHQVKLGELDEWEEKFAPKKKPGRPRKFRTKEELISKRR